MHPVQIVEAETDFAYRIEASECIGAQHGETIVAQQQRLQRLGPADEAECRHRIRC